MKKEVIISIDTCGCPATVGLQTPGGLYKRETTETKDLSTHLTGMIAGVCMDAGIKVQEITKVLTITGTGSFTGIRIGIAAAKGLSVGLNAPITGINVFEVWKETYADKNWLAVLKCGAEEYYVAKHINGELTICQEPLSKETVQNNWATNEYDLYLGDMVEECTGQTSLENWITVDQVMRSGDVISANDAKPFYIKGHYAKKKNVN